MTYSDHRLHTFALHNGLNNFVLEDAVVMSSGKCQLLAGLLKELQASWSGLFYGAYCMLLTHTTPGT